MTVAKQLLDILTDAKQLPDPWNITAVLHQGDNIALRVQNGFNVATTTLRLWSRGIDNAPAPQTLVRPDGKILVFSRIAILAFLSLCLSQNPLVSTHSSTLEAEQDWLAKQLRAYWVPPFTWLKVNPHVYICPVQSTGGQTRVKVSFNKKSALWEAHLLYSYSYSYSYGPSGISRGLSASSDPQILMARVERHLILNALIITDTASASASHPSLDFRPLVIWSEPKPKDVNQLGCFAFASHPHPSLNPHP